MICHNGCHKEPSAAASALLMAELIRQALGKIALEAGTRRVERGAEIQISAAVKDALESLTALEQMLQELRNG